MSKANPRFHRTNAPLPLLLTPAYRVSVFYSVDNQICLWSMDYVMTANTQSAGSEANIASTFAGACGNAIRSCLAADCTWFTIKVQCLSTPSRLPAFSPTAPASQPGLVAGGHIPSEMAAIISKQTFTKGQHGRGRLYLPGIPLSFQTPATDANRLNAAGNTAVGTLGSTILSNTIADAGNVCIAAVTTRVLQGLPTLRGQAISGLLIRLLLGTVRRRRVGRGK